MTEAELLLSRPVQSPPGRGARRRSRQYAEGGDAMSETVLDPDPGSRTLCCLSLLRCTPTRGRDPSEHASQDRRPGRVAVCTGPGL